jgi:hypothetical protein
MSYSQQNTVYFSHSCEVVVMNTPVKENGGGIRPYNIEPPAKAQLFGERNQVYTKYATCFALIWGLEVEIRPFI